MVSCGPGAQGKQRESDRIMQLENTEQQTSKINTNRPNVLLHWKDCIAMSGIRTGVYICCRGLSWTGFSWETWKDEWMSKNLGSLSLTVEVLIMLSLLKEPR